MPIFISYSHEDSEFVQALAMRLVMEKRSVWIDRWEIQVGDSLIEKIQNALTEASAVIVVLSQASVKSEWCKKELNTSLVRELESRQSLLLPIIIEDCEIPMFLREKKYADFRRDSDLAISELLAALTNVGNDCTGFHHSADTTFDWGVDWDIDISLGFYLNYVAVTRSVSENYCAIADIIIHTNSAVTDKFHRSVAAGLEWVARVYPLQAMLQCVTDETFRFMLTDNFPVRRKFQVNGDDGQQYTVLFECRKLGGDATKGLHLDLKPKIDLILSMILQGKPTAVADLTRYSKV